MGGKAKILIVDDDPLVAKSIRSLLLTQGYEVKVAYSGEEAVRIFSQENFDLVISDIRMPKQDGVETVHQMKDLARRLQKQSGFMFVTGYAEHHASQKAAALGIAEFFLKPLDTEYFLQAVRYEIEFQRRESESVDSNPEVIPPDSLIGQWKYPQSQFHMDKIILLKEENILSNAYCSYYIDWQGEAKELLLLQHPDIHPWLGANPHLRLTVHSSHHRFLRDTKFGDKIRIKATCREIHYCSFVMLFCFYHLAASNLIGQAWQKICSINTRNGKLCRLPRLVLDLIEPIQEENESFNLLKHAGF